MNPTLFFENFALLADSPNGIPKLRELILQLAVMGKLVPQDPNDEPASVLLEKIKAEKKKLSKESGLKNDELLPSIEKNEIKFEIPQSWEWIRLGEVINYNGAQKVSPEDIPDDAWLLDLEDIEKNTSKILNYVCFKDKKSKSMKAKFNKGDVLYGKLRPYLNKVVVAEENGYCTTEIVPLNIYTGIDPYYLMYSLKRPDFLEYVNSKTYGIKMPRLGTQDARKALFPLPPLAEQKRIVSKVDELIALCDKLEACRQKKQEIESKLNSAALDKMLSAENQEEFEQYWQRICENFDLLYDNPENVEKLKQAILQLAVQGKLVPQNPKDEPASVLIEKTKVEKMKLIKGGRLKKAVDLTQVSKVEFLFDLPKTWIWISLEDCALKITDGEHFRPQTADYGVFFLSAKDVKENGVSLEDPLYVSESDAEEFRKKCNPEKEDILIVSRGAGVGRSCIINIDDIFCLLGSVILVKPSFQINNKYLCYTLKSSKILNQLIDISGSTAQQAIYLRDIKKLFIPLPPLEEQKRIVEKVEQLIGLCDELETKLRKEREDSEKLMEAVVKGLLEGKATEKTELEKLLPLQVAVH